MGMHFAPQPLVGLDNVAGSNCEQIIMTIVFLLPLREFLWYLGGTYIEDVISLSCSHDGLSHTSRRKKMNENSNFEFPLRAAPNFIVLLALWLRQKPLQFDYIAIRLLNFYTHPPLPEVWLAPELREPFETYSFLVPHSLTLPEYLAQFVCKLDYYSLMFYYA